MFNIHLTSSAVIPSVIRVGFKVTESGNPEFSSDAISGLAPACRALTRCSQPSASVSVVVLISHSQVIWSVVVSSHW